MLFLVIVFVYRLNFNFQDVNNDVSEDPPITRRVRCIMVEQKESLESETTPEQKIQMKGKRTTEPRQAVCCSL